MDKVTDAILPDASRKPFRKPFSIFLLGLGLVPIGTILWAAMTGAVPGLSVERDTAERIYLAILLLAGAVCAASPWLAPKPLWRRVTLTLLALVVVFVVYLGCAGVHFLLFRA